MPPTALARNRSRCSTPNRCCSSTTTMPRLWNSTASCSSACVPMTMPASPPATSSRTCALLLRRHRPGQQRHPGGAVGAAEFDRPSPAGRARRGSTGHAGRQGLPSAPAARTDSRRRPSAPSPAPRRSSCPSPPRPAASGASAWCRRVRSVSTSSTVALTRGEVERQLPPQRGRQPAVPRRRGRARSRSARRADVPPAPTAGRRPRRRPAARGRGSRSSARSRRGGWRAAPRPRSIRFHCRTNGFRQRIVDRVQHVEHLTDARVDVPALHLGRSPDRSGRSPARTPTAARRRRSSRDVSAILASDLLPLPCPAPLEHQERRMRQLHRAVEESDLAGQHQPGALDQVLLGELRR